MALRGANLGLRFLLELCALAALGYWGWTTGSGVTRWLLAAAAGLAASCARCNLRRARAAEQREGRRKPWQPDPTQPRRVWPGAITIDTR